MRRHRVDLEKKKGRDCEALETVVETDPSDMQAGNDDSQEASDAENGKDRGKKVTTMQLR
jgi:hypothetical protein